MRKLRFSPSSWRPVSAPVDDAPRGGETSGLGYADWNAKVNDYVTEREPVEAFTTFVGED